MATRSTRRRPKEQGWNVPAGLALALAVSLALVAAGRGRGTSAPHAGVTSVGDGPISVWGRVTPGAPGVLIVSDEVHGESRIRGGVSLDPGGGFLILGLEPGIYHLLATGPCPAGGSRIATRTITVAGRGPAGPYVLDLEASHVLEGRLVGTDGEPIDGITVWVGPEPLPGDPTTPAPWFPRLVMAARSGEFAFDRLPAGNARLHAWAEGWMVAEMPRVEVPGPPVEMVMVREARLEVTVTRLDGAGVASPVPSASVRLYSPGRGLMAEATTDSDGIASFEGLRPGPYAVDAAAGADITFTPASVDLAEGQEARAGVTIMPGRAIEGVVMDEAGSAPVEGACVVFSSRSETGLMACSDTDPMGRFRIGGLRPGKYAVIVQAAGWLRARLPLVTVSGDGDAGDLAVALLRSRTVSGRVTDAAGTPVEGARVFADEAEKLGSALFTSFLDIHLPDAMPTGPGILPVGELGVTLGPVPPLPLVPGAEAVLGQGPGMGMPPGCACLEDGGREGRKGLTGPSGGFVLDGMSPGEVVLVVVHRDFATLRSQPLLIPAESDPDPVTLILDPGGAIGGLVTNPSGDPVPGAVVWIEGPTTLLAEPIPVDMDGAWMAHHVVGEVKVSASCTGYFPDSRIVTVASGSSSTGIDLVLEPEGEVVEARIMSAWGQPLQGATVTVSSNVEPGAGARTTYSDGDGVVSFPAPPGPVWKIVVSHPDSRTMTILAAPWTQYDEPTLALEQAAGVSGTVTSSWSYMGVDSFEVTVECEGHAPVTRSFESGAFTFTDLPHGECTLAVTAEGYVAAGTALSLPPGDGPLDVTLDGVAIWLDPVDPGR